MEWIIVWCEENGCFCLVDDLFVVFGIGEKLFVGLCDGVWI